MKQLFVARSQRGRTTRTSYKGFICRYVCISIRSLNTNIPHTRLSVWLYYLCINRCRARSCGTLGENTHDAVLPGECHLHNNSDNYGASKFSCQFASNRDHRTHAHVLAFSIIIREAIIEFDRHIRSQIRTANFPRFFIFLYQFIYIYIPLSDIYKTFVVYFALQIFDYTKTKP